MAKSLLDLADEIKKSFGSLMSKAIPPLNLVQNIPKVQQGITNWAAQNTQPAQKIINYSQQVPSVRQFTQNAINTAYPNVAPPSFIPKPFTIPYQISQIGGNLARSTVER